MSTEQDAIAATHQPKSNGEPAEQVKMPALTREQILSSRAIETRTIGVPELGGSVTLRGMTAAERDDWETAVSDKAGAFKKTGRSRRKGGNRDEKVQTKGWNLRASCVVRCIIDPVTNERMFKDDEAVLLQNHGAAVMDVLFQHAQELSGIGEDALEELEKN